LASVATLQYPFNSYRQRSLPETASLRDEQNFTLHVRALFVGFTYALGAGAKAPPTFDFG